MITSLICLKCSKDCSFLAATTIAGSARDENLNGFLRLLMDEDGE